jgi:hypothetical protein
LWCSVGSLGKEFEELGVEHVTVKTVKFIGTENGVRIKSWGRPSNGFARNIIFQHATMVNVKNPILIDQNYCSNQKDCPDQVRFFFINFFKNYIQVKNFNLFICKQGSLLGLPIQAFKTSCVVKLSLWRWS